MDLRFWYWIAVYGLAPFLVIALYWMQERKGASWRVIVPVRSSTRWIAIVMGGIVALLGLMMIWLPQQWVSQWPWSTTPLLTRIFAAWFVAFGAGLLWFLVERDWRRMRLLPTLMIVAVILDLLVVFLHRAEITSTGQSLWVYCGHLIIFGGVGALMHLLQAQVSDSNAGSPYRLES